MLLKGSIYNNNNNKFINNYLLILYVILYSSKALKVLYSYKHPNVYLLSLL
jgi:hypothetical protein